MEQHRWLVYAGLSAACAAAVGLFGKLGVASVDSTLATAVRSAVMTVLLAGVATSMNLWPKLADVTPRAGVAILLSGAAGAASWLFYFKALASPGGALARVAPVDKLSMPLAVVLAVFLLGERPSAVNWAGIALVVAGVYLAAR